MVDAWIICAAVALVLVLVFLYPSEWSWGAGVVAVVAGAGAVYLMPEGMMGGEENSGQRAKTAYEMTFSGGDEYGEDYMDGSNEYGEYDVDLARRATRLRNHLQLDCGQIYSNI